MPPLSVQTTSALHLRVVSGPALDPIVLTGEREIVLGRGEKADIKLPATDEGAVVSRHHCRLNMVAGTWFISDLESKHGTVLNNDRLVPREPRRLARGDLLRIGPWTLRVSFAGDEVTSTVSTQEAPADVVHMMTVADVGRENIHRRRLELLLDCAKRVVEVGDEPGLAHAVLDVLLEGTGYSQAAVIRPAGDARHIEVVGSRSSGRGGEGPAFSRTLIEAAFKGQVVRLRRELSMDSPMTMVSSGIQTALCVPVMRGGTGGGGAPSPEAMMCLYLDSRPMDPPVHEDAAAFCQAVADLCALCLSNIRRGRLEAEKLRTAEQMRAAQDIQRQIMPAARGSFGPLSYALQIYPGQIVAGDLFDIFPVDEHRVAFFIGDVVGKGLPAALVMAVTQTALSACLRRGDDLAQAVDHVNAHLIRTVPDNKFVSAWCGVIDLRTGRLRFVDAGHGYALVRHPGADAEPVASVGGPPLRCGTDGFTIDEMTLTPGARLWLYSDGVVEQPDSRGELFGLTRTLGAISPPREAEAELDALVRAVREHAGPAGTHGLADDLTVVALSFNP